MSKQPDVGDTVLVSWGRETVEAEVEEVYGPSERRWLRVWMPVHGASGEVLERDLITVPLSSVQQVKAA